jgi:hypothetical protein
MGARDKINQQATDNGWTIIPMDDVTAYDKNNCRVNVVYTPTGRIREADVGYTMGGTCWTRNITDILGWLR